MKLLLVTSRIPPEQCGVGDYTWHLAEELGGRHDVTILTARGQGRGLASDHVTVAPVIPDWGPRGMAVMLSAVRRRRPDWVDLQYVPFLYSRAGVNLWLPLAAVVLRALGTRIVLTVHEMFVEGQSMKGLARETMQRTMLVLLVAASRKVLVVTSAWTEMLRRWFFWRRDDIVWLPVGSNIPCVRLEDCERGRLRGNLGIDACDVVLAVLNPLGAGKRPDWLRDVWHRLRRRTGRVKLLVIGQSADAASAVLPVGQDTLYAGYVDSATGSRLLACSDVFLAPFIDGVSARRTSVITALAHGLPVVTTRGPLTDASLFDGSPLVLVPAGEPQPFTEAVHRLVESVEERRALGWRSRGFYQEHFSWSRIADRVMAEIGAGR